MTPSQKYFEFSIDRPQLLRHGVLAAVSGGADSTAMLYRFADEWNNRSHIAVAHINHNLRGNESEADAVFVKQLAARFQIRYIEHRLEAKSFLSEESARKTRYRLLIDTAEQLGLRYLAAAHNADDQTETVLHRIFRGTGLSGLSGMAPMRQLSPAVTLIRPLLGVRRVQITEYLQAQGIDYRIDSTNQKTIFTRNRIRNRLLPYLRRNFNVQIDDAVCKLARLSAENETVQNELLDSVLNAAEIQTLPDRIVLDRKIIERHSSATQRALFVRLWRRWNLPLQAMTFEHWTALTDFLSSTYLQMDLPGHVQVIKNGETLIIIRSEKG
ncbi:hypothetical protein FACS1894170_09830 [Planctomycetales bacterium]|nr:hypothetical protein FACS1894170_09830 [Planctomycetales bacterium]